jgi:hypothetical protein
MGIAIVVNDVDWSASAVAKVTINIPDDNMVPDVMYAAYISKTGRDNNDDLKQMLRELYLVGLLQKCTGLFWLASASNNLEHIKYDVTTLRSLEGMVNITASSAGAKASSGGYMKDSGNYDIANKGILIISVLSTAPTGQGFDWAAAMGEPTTSPYCFISYGSAPNVSDSIIRWNGNDSIVKANDLQEKKGVYSWYAKGNQARYIHGSVDKSVATTASPITNAWFFLLNFERVVINSPSTATMKIYATFNNDLTTDEITQAHLIFDKYKDLI